MGSIVPTFVPTGKKIRYFSVEKEKNRFIERYSTATILILHQPWFFSLLNLFNHLIPLLHMSIIIFIVTHMLKRCRVICVPFPRTISYNLNIINDFGNF